MVRAGIPVLCVVCPTPPARSRVGGLVVLAAGVILASSIGLWPSSVLAADEKAEGQETALSAWKLATHMYRAGNFKKAAELYLTAYTIDKRPEFLANAARAEQRAMMLDEAEKHFEQVLALKKCSDAIRRKARMHLQEVATVRQALAAAEARGKKPPMPPPKPAAAVPAAAASTAVSAKVAPPDVTARSSSAAWRGPAGWATLGTGVVVAGIGGWLLSSWASGQARLDDDLAEQNAVGRVTGTSYDAYASDQRELWSQRRLGAISAGVGLAAMGAGAWMLLSAPDAPTAAVVPTPGGPSLRLGWRF